MNKVLLCIFMYITCLSCIAAPVVDEVADKLPRAVMQPKVYSDYNFESTEKIPIKLKVLNNIKSETDLYEGQYVDFKVVRDITYKNKIVFKRGEIITAKVAALISPGMNGIPGSIIFRDFDISNVAKGQIEDSYEVCGQNRSLLVFPLKWALTILPPTGSLTNFIMGGHAKLKTKKQITLYYYPEWN